MRNETDAALARYSRQILYEHIGADRQRLLLSARVTLIGCGALGSALANMLVRAGVGFLRIIDRDFIELNNLQRQMLFDEQDIADNLPKAEAAARKLARINSRVRVEPVVGDVTAGNIESLIAGAALVLDGTDNLETRFLINDACIKHGVPWIYGACLGATGMMMPILPPSSPSKEPVGQLRNSVRTPDASRGPERDNAVLSDTASQKSGCPTSSKGEGRGGVERAAPPTASSVSPDRGPAGANASNTLAQTPCLRCVWPEPPPPGASETCDTAGILGPTVELVASWQAIEALKILTGQLDAVQRRLLQFDAWTGRLDWFDMRPALEAGDCVCCKQRRFEFLTGTLGSRTAVLCGRDAVQVTPPPGTRITFDQIARKVQPIAATPPAANRFLLRFTIGPNEFTLFADGRAIIKGVSTPDEARSLYARYIGT